MVQLPRFLHPLCQLSDSAAKEFPFFNKFRPQCRVLRIKRGLIGDSRSAKRHSPVGSAGNDHFKNQHRMEDVHLDQFFSGRNSSAGRKCRTDLILQGSILERPGIDELLNGRCDRGIENGAPNDDGIRRKDISRCCFRYRFQNDCDTRLGSGADGDGFGQCFRVPLFAVVRNKDNGLRLTE